MDRSKPKYILAIDFDLTICKSDYPQLGVERDDASFYMKKLYDEGYGIIINTCREGRSLVAAMDWLDEHNIKYDYINCNFPFLLEKYNADCRKISADLYIDDKCLTGLPEWSDVYQIVKRKLPINE